MSYRSDMSFRVVTPRAAEGMSLSLTLNLGGVGPKWSFRCGNCPGSFRARLPVHDDPAVRCPHCGAFNQIHVIYD